MVDATATPTDRNNKQVIFRNCTPFSNCINEINNTKVDNTKDIDLVTPMYHLMQYSNNYSKTLGSLWEYCRDEPDESIRDSKSFNFKSRFLNDTDNTSTVNVEIAVSLRYL